MSVGCLSELMFIIFGKRSHLFIENPLNSYLFDINQVYVLKKKYFYPVLTEMSSVLLMCVDMNVCVNVVLTFG